ncbi:MAG: SO_0444 family Cu/Zn efflux transporter [Pirellulales bacterium]|nr:SO_0444 family Cu/Zn efflux transporter [Pirellulales bacterium]
MLEIALQFVTASWAVLAEMAPYLLFGFLAAGVLSVCIPPSWVERHLGRPGMGPVVTASLLGVPLPLCSCSVIPVAASIRRHGASRAATTSFLLSTPQTGVDSIAVTYALLGPVFAVFRPVVALLTGVIGGLAVYGLDERKESSSDDPADNGPCQEACCAAGPGVSVWRRIFGYALVTLPRDIGPALLVGVLIAGALTGLVKEDSLATYMGAGVLSILLMMVVGVPIYVCATASVPLAAGFMHLGASPGAALAFLIAGPATNAATVAAFWKILGPKATVIYGLTVCASAFGAGMALDLWDQWMPSLAAGAGHTMAHQHAAGIGWFGQAAAVVLLVVLAASFWRPGHAGHEHPDETGGPSPESESSCCHHSAEPKEREKET